MLNFRVHQSIKNTKYFVLLPYLLIFLGHSITKYTHKLQPPHRGENPTTELNMSQERRDVVNVMLS